MRSARVLLRAAKIPSPQVRWHRTPAGADFEIRAQRGAS
jgi:hypothetical protein